jgi:hypothetical protein
LQAERIEQFYTRILVKKAFPFIQSFYFLTLCLGFLLILPGACYQKKYTKEFFKKQVRREFPYDLGHPFKKYVLPQSLQEVSGLEYYKDGIIACNEDEHGMLYLYDTKSEKIERKIKFEKKGDFEGTALSGDTAWVIKSSGQLYMFPVTSGALVNPLLYNNPLKPRNNVEGLCFKADDNSLLIACKDEAGLRTRMEGRAIYRFDISKGTLDEQPFIHITNEIFQKKLKSFGLEPLDHTPFKPSGIAIQPGTGNIYLIAYIGKLLIVFNKNKEIIDILPLKRSMFNQPEGITFSPEGDLFISSEGGDQNGYILQFKPVK